jgi:ubiquinone/menaquinone biosynthesis C-methylase UbiE
MSVKKLIADYWTQNAPYKECCNKEIARRTLEPSVPTLIDKYFHKGDKVLEVGCGLGYDTSYMRSKGINVTAIDLSPANAKIAGGICMDAENLWFKDGFFDKVFSFGVLHHTPNTQKAVNEIHRVLKVGGEAVIMIYHKGYAYWYLMMTWQGMNDYDHTPLSKMYSKSEAIKLFKCFSKVSLTVMPFEGNKRVAKFFYRHPKLCKMFGSFLVIHAVK